MWKGSHSQSEVWKGQSLEGVDVSRAGVAVTVTYGLDVGWEVLAGVGIGGVVLVLGGVVLVLDGVILGGVVLGLGGGVGCHRGKGKGKHEVLLGINARMSGR
mgnify:CR=1 FL=1